MAPYIKPTEPKPKQGSEVELATMIWSMVSPWDSAVGTCCSGPFRCAVRATAFSASFNWLWIAAVWNCLWCSSHRPGPVPLKIGILKVTDFT